MNVRRGAGTQDIRGCERHGGSLRVKETRSGGSVGDPIRLDT